MFEHVAPLEEAELEQLIEGLDQPPYMDRGEFAQLCGIAESTAGKRIRGAGISPLGNKGRLLYRTADLMKVREQYE